MQLFPKTKSRIRQGPSVCYNLFDRKNIQPQISFELFENLLFILQKPALSKEDREKAEKIVIENSKKQLDFEQWNFEDLKQFYFDTRILQRHIVFENFDTSRLLQDLLWMRHVSLKVCFYWVYQ